MSFELVSVNPDSLRPELFARRFNVSIQEAVNMAAQASSELLFSDGVFQVSMSVPHQTGLLNWPPMIHLSVIRLDGEPISGWDDLQRIKNEICGPEHEAVEIYPAESRLVNMGNNRHLWVVSEVFTIPMGWKTRMVKGE